MLRAVQKMEACKMGHLQEESVVFGQLELKNQL
ncbi:rCG30165 [Rattus norvegicus]|uniref:RCG30165 n=1 Tax=Rattus norvegicus TaxID=10116 RepID=A6IMH4_RAT|nr:rCG30165 [Rattus norvegicus]